MGLVTADLTDRFDKFIEQDKERDALLRTLLREIDENKDRIEGLEFELEHERESRAMYQSEVYDLRKKNNKLDKDPFVTVLIDGDGAKFCDEFFKDPVRGAREAALSLQQEVRDYLKDTPRLNSESVTIIVRIFVNLNGLAWKMRSSNIIESENDMRMFAESFNKSRAEFDFVNVGCGKENADTKMRKMLGHFLKNFQCKKIFFGGCHDSGYLHDFSEYWGDQDAKDRIILLETTPVHESFHSLKGLQTTRFNRTFRSKPLESDSNHKAPLPSSKASSSEAQTVTTSAGHEAFLSDPLPRESSPEEKIAISSGNGGRSINYPTTTYATVGGLTRHHNISIASNKTKQPRVINRNANGQRVDSAQKPSFSSRDMTTYMQKCKDIKEQGFCNDHYLLGNCERRSYCKMNHDANLTAEEIAVHGYNARKSICSNGPECDRYGCYLSHHCPWETCSRGALCKFNSPYFGDLHYGKGDMEIATQWTEGVDFPLDLRRNRVLDIST